MKIPDIGKRIPFDLLQDIQVEFSLLTVEDEKRLLLRSEKTLPAGEEFPGLKKQEVLVDPAGFSLNKKNLQIIKQLPDVKSPDLKKLHRVYPKGKTFLKALEKAFGIELTEPLNYDILKLAVSIDGLKTYWNVLEIIAYHSFKSRKIAQQGETYIPLKTKKQFEYYFRAETDENKLGKYDDEFGDSVDSPRYHGIDQTETTTLVFDGSDTEEFEKFFAYVLARICGKLDRQQKRGETAPLMVWHERFKDELIVFFKAKVGGNGYAKDYLDTKIRELQREQKRIKGLDEAALIKDALMNAIESGGFSNREYTCLIARNRGYTAKAISRFTGFKMVAVEEIIETAIPKASAIIFKTYCKKYQQAESEDGYRMTERFVREILQTSSQIE